MTLHPNEIGKIRMGVKVDQHQVIALGGVRPSLERPQPELEREDGECGQRFLVNGSEKVKFMRYPTSSRGNKWKACSLSTQPLLLSFPSFSYSLN